MPTEVEPGVSDCGLIIDPQATLRDVLWHRYIEPSARWLAGESGPQRVRAQDTSSSWETALSAWYLMDVRAELLRRNNPGDALTADFLDGKICGAMTWLLAQSHGREGPRPHWEGVTWDTAAVVRVISRHLNSDRLCGHAFDVTQAITLCGDAMVWLRSEFLRWESDVSYPFGPSDLAQILLTATALEQIDSPVLTAAFGRRSSRRVVSDFIEAIAQRLISAATEIKDDIIEDAAIGGEANAVQSSFWDDWFQSAEVLSALASFLDRKHTNAATLADECHRRVLGAIQYIEFHQSDGRWGGHPETLRSLDAYLRATRSIPDIGREDQIVLKALRWMCDPKQFFDDGSFLHSLYLTVFFSGAALELYSHWGPLADKTVMQAWDDALWNAPVRSTPERSKRLIVQAQRDRAIANLRQSRDVQRRLAGAVAFAVMFLIIEMVGVAYKVISIKMSAAQLFAVIGLVLTFALTIAGAVVKWPRRRKEFDPK
ncbi:MAG: hypothetical protein ACJ74O_02735 [Frankiaceae bacterium]